MNLNLKHKDVQLDMMRQFLIRKIELFNKLSPPLTRKFYETSC